MSVHATRIPGAATENGRAARAVPAESIWPAALAGVVCFILIVANARLRTSDRLQLGAVVLGFAMPAALVWLSGLHRVLRTVEDEVRSPRSLSLDGGS